MAREPSKPALNFPPPNRPGRGRGGLVLAASILVCLLLLLVVINIDRSRETAPAPPTPQDDDDDVIELIEPGPLATDGTMSGGTNAAPGSAGDIILDDGAWVRITDPATRRLKQEYRWQRQNPNPPGRGPGWIEMLRPEARLYLSHDRVVTLEADSALAHVPGQGGLQSGEMNGNVIIRLFERRPDGTLSLDARAAALQVLASQASFDDFTGEISCQGHVDISTPSSEFTGEGLQIRLNDQERDVRISVIVERDNMVRLSRAAMEPSGQGLDAHDPSPEHAAGHEHPAQSRDIAPRTKRTQDNVQAPADGTDSVPANATANSDARDDSPVQYYLLTMHKDVEVQDGSGESGRVIAGDALQMYFSTKSEGFGGEAVSISAAPRIERYAGLVEAPDQARVIGLSERLNMPAIIAALATAAQAERPRPQSLAPPPSPNDIVITCKDQLTIEPIDAGTADLPSAEDARLEILGRPVHVFDAATQATVSCGKLVYSTSGELLEMLATPIARLRFNSPDMAGEGVRFWIVRSGQSAGFTGAGWLEFGEPPKTGRVPLMQMLMGACVMSLDPAIVPDEKQAKQARADRVRIEWSEAVELEFFERAAAESRGGIRSAIFHENIIVLGEEFAMSADSIQVGFSAPGRQEHGDAAPRDAFSGSGQSIQRIDAVGSVVILGLNETGYIACEELRLQLAGGDDGRPLPVDLRATGGVQVSDPRQTLWSDDLAATFVNVERGALDDRESTASRFGNSNVHIVTARGRVEVLFGDGGRAFGDTLVADAVAQTADLTGEHVIVAQDNLLVDRGTRIHLDQRTGSARFDGGGELIQFAEPLSAALLPLPSFGARLQGLAVRAKQNVPMIARRSAAIPMGSGRATLTTTWRDFAVFSGRANDGGGRAEFHGDVQALAERTTLERNAIRADDLELDFAKNDSAGLSSTNNAAMPDTARPGAVSRESRTLRRSLARGTASLEHQSWMNDDHSDAPRIFAIHGETISYDAEHGEALVDGPGRMVVQDLRDEAAAGNAAQQAPFSNEGISRFRWSRSLRMTRQADDASLVVLDGDVALEHLSASDQISTLSADRVEVTIDGDRSQLEDSPLGLAGEASLRHMSAIGSVFVRTSDREIDCSRLEYDEASKLAEIHGQPEKLALVRQRGTPNALRMLEGRWNVETNAVTIIQGAAGGGR